MDVERKMRKNRILNLFLLSIFVLLINSVFASGFGVGFRGSKFELYPGEMLDISYSLQNNDVGTGTIIIEALVEEGGDYVKFLGENNKFEVPEGANVEAPIKINIPETAIIGDTYNVKVLFRQLNTISETESSGTNVGFAFNQRNSFEIEIKEKPSEIIEGEIAWQEKETGNMVFLWLLVGIIAIVIIAWLFIKRNKNDN